VKRFQVVAWVPRGLEDRIGPVKTVVENVPCEVSAHGAKHDVDARGLVSGACIKLVVSIADNVSDETAWNTANDVVVRATNRVLHLAAFAGENQKHFRTLQFRDFHDLAVHDLSDQRRRVVGEVPVERIATIRRKGLTPRTQQLLDILAARSESEALWFDALESAFERRTRDAVVAARAAVEVAWKSGAERIRHAHRGTTPRTVAMVEALVAAAVSDALPLPQRLDKHSAPIFGESFKARWKDMTWQQVSELLFTVRNRGAHGSGPVTEMQAHRAVVITRDVLDDIEVVCSAVEGGVSPPPSSI